MKLIVKHRGSQCINMGKIAMKQYCLQLDCKSIMFEVEVNERIQQNLKYFLGG